MIETYNAIAKFFHDGGFFLYPIALVFAIGIAIIIERWTFLSREKAKNKQAFDNFLPQLKKTNIIQMQASVKNAPEAIMRVIACGLDMMSVSRQRADVESAMSEGVLEALPKLEARTGQLAMLANIATLLGLLGTIIGLISAFTAVASADPAEKSQLLSLSISVAMNTTAFGLISAIPLLIFHSLLKSKTEKIVTSIEISAIKFLNIMTVNGVIEAGAQTEPASTSTEQTSY